LIVSSGLSGVTPVQVLRSHAHEAYDALAPAYDVFVGDYAYNRWLPALEQLAVSQGLTGRRLLDVACGTGASFLPLLARGYDVTACDVSQAMLDVAQAKAPDVDLHQADMRELPVFGSFDLVTCIDDALNYLLDEDELEAALRGFAQNLDLGGIALWDLNTVAQYRGQFARDRIVARDEVFIGWHGNADNAGTGSGDVVEVAVDVFELDVDGTWTHATSTHRQRHWPRALVEELAWKAGLGLVAVRGQHPGVVIDTDLDELTHTKAIYLAKPR
jgi:SAM-dependent methyltransferase